MVKTFQDHGVRIDASGTQGRFRRQAPTLGGAE
jgi:GH35 family endo-1,4-beta-xylanase